MLKKTQHVPAQLAPGQRPVLLVIVDTEGEFAWDQPFNRNAIGTSSIANQPLMHARVFDAFGIVPTYMVDWPVATTPAAIATLRRLLDAGRCEIGAHLHPWVSPPYEEVLSDYNSYGGNLPRQLEFDKLRLLTETIADSFGQRPRAFKAGRYGLGPHTADSIAALGYDVDASVVPYSAFTADGGPDFRAFDEHPYWFQAGKRELLELPVTTGYCGWLRNFGPRMYDAVQMSVSSRPPSNRSSISDLPHMGQVHQSALTETSAQSPEVSRERRQPLAQVAPASDCRNSGDRVHAIQLDRDRAGPRRRTFGRAIRRRREDFVFHRGRSGGRGSRRRADRSD